MYLHFKYSLTYYDVIFTDDIGELSKLYLNEVSKIEFFEYEKSQFSLSIQKDKYIIIDSDEYISFYIDVSSIDKVLKSLKDMYVYQELILNFAKEEKLIQ